MLHALTAIGSAKRRWWAAGLVPLALALIVILPLTPLHNSRGVVSAAEASPQPGAQLLPGPP